MKPVRRKNSQVEMILLVVLVDMEWTARAMGNYHTWTNGSEHTMKGVAILKNQSPYLAAAIWFHGHLFSRCEKVSEIFHC